MRGGGEEEKRKKKKHFILANFAPITFLFCALQPATKFEAVRQIAGFIGSDAFTNDELCCLVGMPEEFMGSHTVKGRGEKGSAASSKLSSRFGHWRAKLEGKAALSEAMHKEGARGLNLFGYQSDGSHPAPAPALDGYTCALTPADCKAKGIAFKPAGGGGSGKKELKSPGRGYISKPPGSYFVPPDSPTCGFAHDTDYKGGGHDITMGDEADAAGCCERCRKTSGCSYFTFVPEQRLCYLKRGTGSIVHVPGLISGKAA